MMKVWLWNKTPTESMGQHGLTIEFKIETSVNSRNNLVYMSVSSACHSIVFCRGSDATDWNVCHLRYLWLKATVQEPGENAAASAIGGAWNVGTRWFIGERETNICWGQHQPFPISLGLFGYFWNYILEDKGYQVLELEATSVLGDTLAPSHW